MRSSKLALVHSKPSAVSATAVHSAGAVTPLPRLIPVHSLTGCGFPSPSASLHFHLGSLHQLVTYLPVRDFVTRGSAFGYCDLTPQLPSPSSSPTSHGLLPTKLSPFLFPTQPRAFLRLPLSYLCPECILSFLPSLLLLNSPTQLSHHHLIYQHFLFFPPSPFALCTVSSVGLACSAWNHRVWSAETGSSFYPGGSSRGRVKSRRPPSQPLRSTAHLPPAWAVQSCQETVSLHVSRVVQG